LGTGTSTVAAMASCRNSLGYEIDPDFADTIVDRTTNIIASSNRYSGVRLERHLEFVRKRTASGARLKYRNENYGFPVMTKHETGILINDVREITMLSNSQMELRYDQDPQEIYCSFYDAHAKDSKVVCVEADIGLQRRQGRKPHFDAASTLLNSR